MKRHLDVLVLLPLIFFFAFQPNFLHGPIEYWDEGFRLSAIDEVLRGHVPYRDFFLLHGPLSVYLSTLFMRLFGITLASHRAFYHLSSILTLLIAYLIGRNTTRSWLFRIFLVFLLVTEVVYPYWSTRWGGFRMGAGLLVLWFLIQHAQRERPLFLLGAGVMTTSALLLSTEAGISSFLASCMYLAGRRLEAPLNGRMRLWKDVKTYGWGIAALLLPFGLYFLWVGALGPYLHMQFVMVPSHSVALSQRIPSAYFHPWDLRGDSFFLFLCGKPLKVYTIGLVFLLTFVRLLKEILRKKWKREQTILATVGAYGALSYGIGFRAVDNVQFGYALLPFLILICLFLDKIFMSWRRLYRNLSRKVAEKGRISVKEQCAFCSLYGVMMVTMLFLIVSPKWPFGTTGNWLSAQRGKIYSMVSGQDAEGVQLDLDRMGPSRLPASQAREVVRVTRFLMERTNPHETLFTYPEQGLFNFLADRPPVGRFPTSSFAWVVPAYREELFRDLKKAKPRYIVRGQLANLAWATGQEGEILPEVAAYIDQNYRRIKEFEAVGIYERRIP